MEERRKFFKLNSALEVTYKPLKEIICRNSCSKNISSGGVSFSIAYPLECGFLIEIWIKLKDFKNPVRAVGKVVWVKDTKEKPNPYLIGIQFVQIDPSDKKILVNQLRLICQGEHITPDIPFE